MSSVTFANRPNILAMFGVKELRNYNQKFFFVFPPKNRRKHNQYSELPFFKKKTKYLQVEE